MILFSRRRQLAFVLGGCLSLSVSNSPIEAQEVSVTPADIAAGLAPTDEVAVQAPAPMPDTVPPAPTAGAAPAQPAGPCGRPDCPVCNPAPKPAAPPPAPWKPLYFDNDFSYKGKPNAPHFLGEELKNMPLFDDCCETSVWTLSAGGEIRHRYMDEDNRLRPGGPGRSTYDLYRWRQYVDLKAGQDFRIYFEGIDASIFDNELPVTGIDKNRWDIQNFFWDVKIAERDGKPVYFRTGRQELLFGTPSAVSPGQQVISPLDWANTRRNFQGFRMLSKGETLDVDLFAVRPVNTANPTGGTGGRRAVAGAAGPSAVDIWDNQLDRPDYSRWYSGIYTVYRGIKGQTIEPYYVWLQTDPENHVGPAAPGGTSWADGNRHTLGVRWTATKPIKDCCDQPFMVLASDIEGAYQFGKDNDLDVQAGFFTAKLGATFSQAPWTPNLSFLYYFGSGDDDPTDGTNNTYNVLVPLNHAYWGIIDNLAGQNLNDIGIQATVKPHAKLTCISSLHWFSLVTNGDTLYNVVGAPTGAIGAGKDIGEELDLIATYAHNPNFDIQVGYSWFWYGSRIVDREDATQFYVQTSLRY